jgi:hypothetical protein
VLLVFTVSPPVRAETAQSPHDQRNGTIVRLGTVVGFSHLAGTEVLTLGGHVAVGYRFGPLSLYGELDSGSMDAMPRRLARTGDLERLGAVARLSLLTVSRRFSGPDSILVFWAEGGVGRQLARWSEGDTLTRNDVAVGAGWTLDHRLRPLRSGKPAYIGWHFGWRFTASRRAAILPAIAACKSTNCPPPPRGDAPLDVGLVVTSAMTLSW